MSQHFGFFKRLRLGFSVKLTVSNEREVNKMITIKDARKIVAKLSETMDAIFINEVLITTFDVSGIENKSFKATYDNETLTFWRGSIVIASINYENVISIETLTEAYDIKEGRWK